MNPLNKVIDYVTKQREDAALFSFHLDPVLPFATAEQLRPFTKDDVDLDEFEKELSEHRKEYTKENILEEMKGYLEFAFGKAYDERGLSAIRSIQKMQTYLVMLDNEELAEQITEFEDYGLPQLRAIDRLYFEGKVDPGE